MPESPLKVFRRLPGPVRLLIYGTFINRFGGLIIPFMSLVLKRNFGLEEDRLKYLLMSYGIGSLFAILAGGWLTDKMGRRTTMAISLLGGGVLAIAMGFANSYAIFAPLLLLYGFVGELYRPAASAILGDLLPSPQRPAGFAALRLAVNLGFAFGTAMGGFLADLDWRLIFWGDGVTTLLFGILVVMRIPETRPVAAVVVPGEKVKATASPWTDGVYLLLTFCSFIFSLVFFQHITVFPLTVDAAGYKPWVFGWLVALNCLLVAMFEMSVVEWLRTRFRRLRVAALGMLLIGAGFAATGLGTHWSWLAFTVVIWTAGEILDSPQMMAFIADWSPPEARGRYLSLYQASWSLAFACNPLLFLPLHARLPEAWFWSISLLLTLPAAWALLRLDRIADRPERLRGATE